MASRCLLSAAMIVRNEEARLAACLRSIRDVVDEIALVDTGSTDATIDIARSFGARVIESPWREDFSYHRNESLALARGEWVLVVDGDEELADAGDLRALVERHADDPDVDGIAVRVDGVLDERIAEQMMAVRSFRRSVGRYRYPVHNQLEGVVSAVGSTAVVRAHYSGTMAEKAHRSLPMLEAMLARDPEDEHALFFLAKTWFAVGQFARCREVVERFLVRGGDSRPYAGAWVMAFYAALATESVEAAEAVLARGVARHPRFSELRHCQLVVGALRWNESAGSMQEYWNAGHRSLAHLVDLPAAATLLGLPVEFDGPEERDDSRPLTREKRGGVEWSARRPPRVRAWGEGGGRGGADVRRVGREPVARRVAGRGLAGHLHRGFQLGARGRAAREGGLVVHVVDGRGRGQ